MELGRRFGKSEGSVYPHDIVSPLSEGDKVKAGDVVAYNTGFFEPDMLNPKQVIMKNSMAVKTALLESYQTLEDSSAISARISDKMAVKTTKIRSFVVDFKQAIHKVAKEGTAVGPSDILLYIEDAVTSGSDIFDEASIATLSRLSTMTPKARVFGTVDKVVVIYHGLKEDMSPTLRTLVNASDKRLAETAKAINDIPVTGSVGDDYRVSGTPLALDTAEIQIYLTITSSAGIGDKGVFGNQMKTTVGEVYEYPVTTESGDEVEAIFGQASIAARIVNSPAIIGTTTTLLKVIAKQAVAIYRK